MTYLWANSADSTLAQPQQPLLQPQEHQQSHYVLGLSLNVPMDPVLIQSMCVTTVMIVAMDLMKSIVVC